MDREISRDPEMIEINKIIENLDYENAKKQLQKKLKKEPNNVEVLDTLSEVLMNMDEVESEKIIKVCLTYNY